MATLPENPQWEAKALADIADGSTLIIISNSTTATNVALPSTATNSNPAKKICEVTTADGVTTITAPEGSSLQDLAWTLVKSGDNYKFYQEGSEEIRMYLTGLSTNTGLRIGNANSANDEFVMGDLGHLLKVTTGTRFVGPYDNNGSDWRTYNTENATNYKGAALTFYVLKASQGGEGGETISTVKTVYCKAAQDWWKVDGAVTGIYAFKGEAENAAWPGVRMTAVEGETDLWKADIDTALYSTVIFTRMNPSDEGDQDWGAKTADLEIPADKDLYTITSTAAVWGDPGVAGEWSVYVPAKPAEDITFYLINNQEWTTPTAHVFTAGGTSEAAWPGKAMTKTEDKVNGFDVYSYTFKDNFTKIIFNDGKAENTTQTIDLTWDKAKPYFVPGSLKDGKYDGTWYATKEEIPAPPTPKYNIAGVWTSWKLVELAVAADEKTATYEVELAKGDYEFKIVRTYGTDTTWLTKENEGAFGLHREYPGVAGVTSTANNNLSVKVDENGVYKFTWTFANDSIGIEFPAKHALNEIWGVNAETAVAAGTVYADNYAINIKTVYAGTLKENARAFGGVAFSHVIQVRNAAYPSAGVPEGTEQSGSTSLVVTAKEDVEITMYYNRQTTNSETGAAALNDGKDMIVFDQAAPTTALEGDFRVVWMQEDKKYVNAIKTISLVKGHTYTVSAKGTTVQLSGIRYATDAEAPVAKYFIVGNAEAFGEWKTFVPVYEDAYEIKDLAAGDYKFRIALEKDNWESTLGYTDLTAQPEGLIEMDDNNIGFTLKEKSDFKVTYKPAVGEEKAVFTVEAKFYVPEKKDLYLVPGVWAEGKAKIAAWLFGDEINDQWTGFFAPKAEENDTLVAKINADADSIIFVRFKTEATEPTWDGGDGYIWNKMANDSINYESLVYTITGWGEGEGSGAGTWDVYVPVKFYVIGGEDIVGEGKYDWKKEDALPCYTDTMKLDLASGEHKLKVITVEGSWKGFEALTDTAAGLYEDVDGNICFKLPEAGEVRVIYIAGEKPVFKLEGKFYVPVLADGYYLVGDKYNWTPVAERMFLANTEKEGEYYLHNIKLAAEDSLKVVYVERDEIKEWLPKEADNYVVDADHAGLKSIYFNPAGKGGDDWYYGTIYIAANPKYFTKYAPNWEWKLMTEKEGLWLTDTIVYRGIGVNINDVADDDKNLFYSNTAQEEGVRKIAGVEFAEKDTVYFTFNPADSVLTAVMVGKYVKPVIPMVQITLVPGVWNVDGAKFAAVAWKVGETMEANGVISEDWFVGTDTVVGEIPAAADSVAFARFDPKAAEPTLDMSVIWNHSDKLLIDKTTMIYTISGWAEEGRDYCPGYWGAPYVPTLKDGYYLVGNKYNWTPAAERLFAKNTVTEGEYYLENVVLATDDSIKVVYVEKDVIKTWYPGENNYVVDANHAGTKTIYFNPTYQEAWGGNIYIEKNSATAITNTAVEGKAVKTISNGMLIIEKAGVRYNVMGQIIR